MSALLKSCSGVLSGNSTPSNSLRLSSSFLKFQSKIMALNVEVAFIVYSKSFILHIGITEKDAPSLSLLNSLFSKDSTSNTLLSAKTTTPSIFKPPLV